MTTRHPSFRTARRAAEQPIRDDGVEALSVVSVTHLQVADIILPAFEQRLEGVALIELGILTRAIMAGQVDVGARR